MSPSSSDLFQLQPTDDTVTPTELVDTLRAMGRKVSRRTLSFWQSQGILPPALRVGSRGGVYPRSVVELALFVVDSRDRGMSVETIRELVPLWQFIGMSMKDGVICLDDFEQEARSLSLSREASFQVPQMIEHRMRSVCANCATGLSWRLKDGREVAVAQGVQLSFVVAETSAQDGLGDVVAWTQLSLPGMGDRPELDDPNLVILGLPNGICMRPTSSCVRTPVVHARRPSRSTSCTTQADHGQQEVLQLTS